MIKSKNIRKIVVYGRGMADTISFRCFVYQGFGDVDFSFYDIHRAQSPSSEEATRLALNFLKVFTDEYIGADDSRVVSFYRTARKSSELSLPENFTSKNA